MPVSSFWASSPLITDSTIVHVAEGPAFSSHLSQRERELGATEGVGGMGDDRQGARSLSQKSCSASQEGRHSTGSSAVTKKGYATGFSAPLAPLSASAGLPVTERAGRVRWTFETGSKTPPYEFGSARV